MLSNNNQYVKKEIIVLFLRINKHSNSGQAIIGKIKENIFLLS